MKRNMPHSLKRKWEETFEDSSRKKDRNAYGNSLLCGSKGH